MLPVEWVNTYYVWRRNDGYVSADCMTTVKGSNTNVPETFAPCGWIPSDGSKEVTFEFIKKCDSWDEAWNIIVIEREKLKSM